MTIPIRKAIRIILLNDNNELLLMYVENFDIKTVEGETFKGFWFTPGGAIEAGENINQTTLREIYEETGITKDNLQLGPVIWHGTEEVILKGKHTLLDETYVLVKTTQKDVSLHNATEEEQQVIKKMRWFSLKDIQEYDEPIFPVSLAQHLPDIINGKYPEKPIEIQL